MSDETKNDDIATDAVLLRAWKEGAPLPSGAGRTNIEIGRIRREFLSGCVFAQLAIDERGAADWVWNVAEDMLREGQRRGRLP